MKKRLTAVVLAFAVVSCGEKVVYKGETFNKGLELYQKGEYDDAKELLKEAIYKAKDMTTTDIMKARYYLANIYFQQGNYIDAIVEFEEFLSLYPTAPQVPEVLYKLAVSYLKISPSPDRDLTYIRKAMEKAEELIDNYPNSPYVEEAKKIIQQAKKIEAQHLINIADLYERLQKHYSASVYYQLVFEEYPDQIKQDFVIYKIAYNLLNVDKQYTDRIKEYKERIKKLEEKIKKEKDIDKKTVLMNRKKLLEKHLSVLEKRIDEGKQRAEEIIKYALQQYPNSQYKKDMEKLLEKIKQEEKK
ncbi:MAG: outer membrane protein assembly factor BamD [Aquificae bacterium]|nr:outer membrane protein assembly factor BamD [Aquificota bacterium]